MNLSCQKVYPFIAKAGNQTCFILFINDLNVVALKKSGIQGQNQSVKKVFRVIILATGGTIEGSGASSTKSAYTAGKIPIDDLINAVPQIDDYDKITGEQIAQICSQDVNVCHLVKIVQENQ